MNGTAKAIDEFVGSTHLFSLAMNNAVEEKLSEEMADIQLTPSQITVLKLLSRSEVQRVGEIATCLGVSNAAASKAVDRLVRRKLMERKMSENDRRMSELALTDAGRKAVEQYEQLRLRMLEQTFRQVSAQELRKAAELLDRLAASIVSNSERREEICLQCYVSGRKKCLVRGGAFPGCLHNRTQRPPKPARRVRAGVEAGEN